MKNQVSFLLAIFAIVLSSCSDKGFFSEPAQSALNGMNNLNKELQFSLDWINKNQITPGENVVQGDFIEVVGWAVDAEANQPASKVYLSIGGNLFTTEYGIVRDDVANYFKNPAMQKCGFKAKIARTTLPSGVYPLEIKVIGADKTGYLSSPPERAVSIRF